MVLSGADSVPDTQVLARTPAGREERTGTGADFGRLLGELTASGWLGAGRGIDAEVHPGVGTLEVVIVADAGRRPSPRMASVMAEAWAQAGAHRRDPLRVRVERRPSQRVAARVRGVPGYGWAAFRPAGLGAEAVRGEGTWLENSHVRIDIDPDDGTFAISGEDGNGVAGLGRLVDDGEEGDTYNHSPPGGDSVVQHPERVELQPVEGGPVRATVRTIQHFTWPAGVVDGRRAGQRPVVIVTDIQLHAAEDFVRVAVRFDNPSRDHRLRAWFPLPRRTDHTVAECAFATVRRGAASGGPHEAALATYPARRFVAAGGLTLTHEGLLEYELVDDGAALALTLLRATGMLSRPAPSARPNPAGPEVRLEAPQLLGPQQARYAVARRGHQSVAAGRRRLAGAEGDSRQRDGPVAIFGQPSGDPRRRGVGPAPPGRGRGHRGAGLQPGRRAGHGGDTRSVRLAGRPAGPEASSL